MVIASTAIHPSSENPANHLLVFTEYANDESWIAVHTGQFAGVVIVFAGGFVALLSPACPNRIKYAFCASVDWSCTCYNGSQCLCCSPGC
jgi:hypothetical protein